MRVLLDTHVWIWLQYEPERVPEQTFEILAAAETDRLLSLASCWEIAIKAATGKLRLPLPLREFISARLETSATDLLPISLDHALGVASLPRYHRDPFDRLLIAQALAEGLTVATVDSIFSSYGVATLSV